MSFKWKMIVSNLLVKQQTEQHNIIGQRRLIVLHSKRHVLLFYGRYSYLESWESNPVYYAWMNMPRDKLLILSIASAFLMVVEMKTRHMRIRTETRNSSMLLVVLRSNSSRISFLQRNFWFWNRLLLAPPQYCLLVKLDKCCTAVEEEFGIRKRNLENCHVDSQVQTFISCVLKNPSYSPVSISCWMYNKPA